MRRLLHSRILIAVLLLLFSSHSLAHCCSTSALMDLATSVTEFSSNQGHAHHCGDNDDSNEGQSHSGQCHCVLTAVCLVLDVVALPVHALIPMPVIESVIHSPFLHFRPPISFFS